MNGVIGTLVEACETYIRRFDLEGARKVADGIARWKQSERNPLPANPEPSCGYLDAALAATQGDDQLRDAIIAARTEMRWITYDSYDPAEIGPRFPKAHAFVSLVGEHGHVRAQDFELGLFLIAPGTLYRDHHHAAPELYVPLTGPHLWRFEPGTPWIEKPAHEPVWNEPWAIHATLVTDVPFLCLFGWTRDVNSPAKTVFAADWPMLEAGL